MIDTLLRMRVFVAVYEEGSFTSAACREHLTQSGVTQHVQKLEEYFNVRLFVRGGGKVSPTPVADSYYRSCVSVLGEHQQARKALLGGRGALDGEVVVGLTPVLTRAALAPAISGFMLRHPNVRIRVLEGNEAMLGQRLRAGEVDFAVVAGGYEAQSPVRRLAFVRSPEFLVSGRRCPFDLRHSQPVQLASLGPLSLVLPAHDDPRRMALEEYLAACGVQVCRRMEIDTALGTLDFVAHTEWLTFMPAVMLLREVGDTDIVVNPLAGSPGLELHRIERAGESLHPAASAFEAALRAQAALLVQRALALAGCPIE